MKFLATKLALQKIIFHELSLTTKTFVKSYIYNKIISCYKMNINIIYFIQQKYFCKNISNKKYIILISLILTFEVIIWRKNIIGGNILTFSFPI